MVVKSTRLIAALGLTLLFVFVFAFEPVFTLDLGEECTPIEGASQGAVIAGGAGYTSLCAVNAAEEGEGEDSQQAGTQPPSQLQCSTDLPNVENAREVWDYLRSLGLSEIVVAGIIGNIDVESGAFSGYDPDTHQLNGPAYGLAQWEPPRLGHLQDYAELVPGTEADLYVQLDFLYFELTGVWPQGKEPNGPYSYTGDAIAQNHYDQNDNLVGATSPQQAAIIFLDRFERAGVRKEEERQAAAAGAFEMFTGQSSLIGDCAAGTDNG